jgi:dTDP-glucose pyrophosphorylase/CBS domain-containing protein
MRGEELRAICLAPEASLRAAIERINLGQKGLVLVTDQAGRLLGTITDGDVRRAILAGQDLSSRLGALLTLKADSPYGRPVSAPLGSGRGDLLKLMRERSVRQVPLLDQAGRVAELVTREDLEPAQDDCLEAVIMAGGQGLRLRPMTETLPKPMLPLGERPLMEHILGQLREAGITRVGVATHYLPEKIKDHFGDGAGFGVELSYLTEERPLGTAGALSLMQPPAGPLLVINGDILTRVDFKAMLAFHQEQDAQVTVGVRQFHMDVPYGVVQAEGGFVSELTEKPVYRFFVNAGIYLLQPAVFRYLSRGRRLDMTELIQALLAESQRVASFPIHEYWLDIGQHQDYLRAQEDLENGRL